MRMAQSAAIALGVSAAALWALQVPGIQDSLPEKPEVAPYVAPPTAAARAEAPVIDSETAIGLAERLEIGAGVKRPESKPVAEGPRGPEPEATGEWKFLSTIREGSRLLAVVSKDGVQKVMRLGRTWNGGTLKAVDETRVVIEDSAGRHEIRRGERSGPSVAWTKMPTTGAPGPMEASGAARLEEEIARRGIDPGQAQRFRDEWKRLSQARNGAARVPGTREIMDAFGMSEEQIGALSPEEIAVYRNKLGGGARTPTADGAAVETNGDQR